MAKFITRHLLPFLLLTVSENFVNIEKKRNFQALQIYLILTNSTKELKNSERCGNVENSECLGVYCILDLRFK